MTLHDTSGAENRIGPIPEQARILALCGEEPDTSVVGLEGQPSPVMRTVMDLNLGVLLPDLNLEK